MKKLLFAGALLAASATANATIWEVTLTKVMLGSDGRAATELKINPAPSFPADTPQIPLPIMRYNDATTTLTMTGKLDLRSQTTPTTGGRLFDHYITNLVINGATGDTSGTTSYECENHPTTGTAAGGFGQNVGANMCGNYTLGDDYVDNSTLAYSGLTVTRTIAGDDAVSGDPQSIATYALLTQNFTAGPGGTLVMQSADWNPTSSAGLQMTFSVGAVAPVLGANDDTATTYTNTPVTINTGANDTGFDDPATITITTAAAHGATVINGSPGDAGAVTITYTPAAGYHGTDSFVYQVADGTNTLTATVNVTVNEPTANNDTATTRFGEPVVINALANDGGFTDPVTVTITSPPNKGGTAVVVDAETGDEVAGGQGAADDLRIRLTPNQPDGTATYTESFTYQITDGTTTKTATVAVTVNNAVPVANDGTMTIAAPATSGTIDVSTITGNALGDAPATVTATSTTGTVSVSGNVVTYTTTATSGTGSFNYTITDDDGETATGTVTVTIQAAQTDIKLPGGSSAVDLWSLALLGGLPLLRRRRR